MVRIHKSARVGQRTITAWSANPRPLRTTKAKRPDSIPAEVDGSLRYVKVDPRIMAWLRRQHIDFRYVEVRSPTEVIVHNQPIR